MAKRELKEKNLSLVIVKGEKIIFKSNLQGLTGLIQAIDSLGNNISSSSVADKIVGRAAALLIAYFHAEEVYAATISERGLDTLKKYGVRVEYDTLVPEIMNRWGTDICPFEKLSLIIESPNEAYRKIKRHLEFTEEMLLDV
ncbi:MAG: DUF1893 domain-containing protein [Candidatus Bathyarchaeota archaeon]|nr:DUF1893 domain-containing protein [Candidatus Bathyarchaeota archaeon]